MEEDDQLLAACWAASANSTPNSTPPPRAPTSYPRRLLHIPESQHHHNHNQYSQYSDDYGYNSLHTSFHQSHHQSSDNDAGYTMVHHNEDERDYFEPEPELFKFRAPSPVTPSPLMIVTNIKSSLASAAKGFKALGAGPTRKRLANKSHQYLFHSLHVIRRFCFITINITKQS